MGAGSAIHVPFIIAAPRRNGGFRYDDEDGCAPRSIDLAAQPEASRLAERIPGKAVVTELEDESGRLHVTWRVILRDGSNYVRQEVTVTAKRGMFRCAKYGWWTFIRHTREWLVR